MRGEGSNVESLTMRGYGGESDDCWVIYIFTQRAQRAQRFYPHSYLRLRWSGRKLRYDERAQRVYPPPPPCGVLAPVSGGESER